MPLTKYVKEWLTRAEEDLQAAELMLREGGFPNPISFHAQQSAEKFLKGFLAYQEKHVRKIHDLRALVEMCKEINKDFAEIEHDATFLTQFYVEARYPGDYPEFTMQEAQKAYDTAMKIRNFVSKKIK